MNQVNVIDSIVITEERDTSRVLAEWSVLDPSITFHSNLQATQAVKLFFRWSDQNGTLTLQHGDCFAFVVPDVFRQDRVKDVTDAAIKSPLGEVVATYSIYDNNGKKEVKITFTDYVETHTNISGNFWFLLFVGRVDSTEEKTIEFIRFNMEEDAVNGFHALEDFSFEDVIPEDSPHVFLIDEIRQELGLLPNQFPLRVGEYKWADSYPPENRYPVFNYQYNSIGANYWTNFNLYNPLINGYTTVDIDGIDGLNISDVVLTEKLLSAKLGTLTRPTTIQYCTMATVKIAENALGDSEIVKLFKNTFKVNHGYDINSSLDIYLFGSGGEGQGITGDYSFTFTKVGENGAALPGAMFSLYLSEEFESGADRIVYSGDDGVVTFLNLPAGIYYLKETVTPHVYIPNNTVYKVELSSEGFEIYYGDNFENKLSDYDNKIVNRLEYEVLPVSVTLEGTKILTGKTLERNMFNFVVKDSDGATIAAGINAANGKITFSEIGFDTPGLYAFTVEEVTGSYSGITYDNSQYTVTVAVTDDGSGKLTAETTYPNESIVFNNSYAEIPVKPCQCFAKSTKCRKTIEGQKIWVDNKNAGNTRPFYVKITLLRDGEVYKSLDVDSTGDGTFVFCCVPIGKKPGHKYDYQIVELDVPDGYTKTIEGYNVINTLIP